MENAHTSNGYIIFRHAERKSLPESEIRGISETGRAGVRKFAPRLIEIINESEPGTVFLFGACSEHIRTDATALAYADEIRRTKKNKELLTYFPAESVKDWQMLKYANGLMSTAIQGNNSGVTSSVIHSLSNTVNEMKRLVLDNPSKKLFMSLPIYLKNFSFFRHGWIDYETKDFNEYTKSLFRECGNSNPSGEGSAYMTRRWLETKGECGELRGPNPVDCMKDFETGVKRYSHFCKEISGNRPLITGIFGHAWEVDAYVLQNITGELEPKSFEDIFRGKAMDFSEFAFIQEKSSNSRKVQFRGGIYN